MHKSLHAAPNDPSSLVAPMMMSMDFLELNDLIKFCGKSGSKLLGPPNTNALPPFGYSSVSNNLA